MLTRFLRSRPQNLINSANKAFSTASVGLGDIGEVTKVHYTEEFDQGLTED